MDCPVILIDKNDKYLDLIKDESSLTTTNSLALKRHAFTESYIIDSQGYKYMVKSASKVKNINPFWKFEFFNPIIQVKIDLKEEKSKIDFTTFKNKLINLLSNDRSLLGFRRQT